MKPSTPAFHNVLDLGLRDVGVKNEPRRLAAHFGKRAVPLFALCIVFVFVACAVLRRTGADIWTIFAFAVAWTGVLFALAIRTVKRAPVAVVRITAAGNQATWHLIGPFLSLALAVALTGSLLLIPLGVLMVFVAVLVWRGRGRLPELLRRFHPLLAPDETVLGDGIGLVKGERSRHEALRLVVATDRRVLVAATSRSPDRFLRVDLPYERVSRFGIDWKYRGRMGELSLTVEGGGGAPAETHVITSVPPANLLSIAQALLSNGVHTDDASAVWEAEQAWEAALRRGRSQRRPLDRAAMRTPEFDRGLWLLLGLSAVIFYANPFGAGLGASRDAVPVLLGVPVLCAVCGYVSRTRSSLAYVVPLNLLVLPAFFFADAGDVISVMFVLSGAAAAGLWAGSALRRGSAATAAPRAARGTLRYTLSALGLIRLSAMLIAGMVALVATSAAAGFELTSVRLAVQEATAEQLPVDGRSNLTGDAASLTYTPGPGLRELVTDEQPLAGPDDGARWELRSSFTKGYNVVTLGHYVVEPRLDNPAAVDAFLADKDRAHSRLAGFPVTYRPRVVDGRKGYVWKHGSRSGYWYYAAWFPQPVHSVRVECVARGQKGRFKRLCAEAIGSLEFH